MGDGLATGRERDKLWWKMQGRNRGFGGISRCVLELAGSWKVRWSAKKVSAIEEDSGGGDYMRSHGVVDRRDTGRPDLLEHGQPVGVRHSTGQPRQVKMEKGAQLWEAKGNGQEINR